MFQTAGTACAEAAGRKRASAQGKPLRVAGPRAQGPGQGLRTLAPGLDFRSRGAGPSAKPSPERRLGALLVSLMPAYDNTSASALLVLPAPSGPEAPGGHGPRLSGIRTATKLLL